MTMTADRQHTRQRAATLRAAADHRLAAGLVAIAAGLSAVALLGPLATGVVRYRVTETLRNQTIGLDTASLLLVAPLAVLAAVLVLRGRDAGRALAMGIGAYTSYMFLQYVVGPDYGHLEGNNQLLFPLCAALFALGWMVALGGWVSLDAGRLPVSPARDRRVGRVILPVLALLAFGRYAPTLADWMTSSPSDGQYVAGPSFAWAIALLDLGVFLPATVATCVGLVRGAPWARKAQYLVAGWFGLVGPAVAAMAVVMQHNGDPNASGASAAFMTALGAAFAVLAGVLFLPLLRHRR
jgi:hypothetical protein